MAHTKSGGGKRTTSASGINVVVVGDKETNANLGDDVQDHDGACDDDKVDCIRSGSGEPTTDAGSLGDGLQQRDGYQQSRRV